MEIKDTGQKIKIILIIISLLSIPLFFFAYSILCSSEYTTQLCVNVLSIAGVILLILEMISYYLVYGRFFDLYIIFLLFFSLFNFGQCLLWAFGIHFDGELGTARVYGQDIPSYENIICAQLIFLETSLIMHSIALFNKEKYIKTEECIKIKFNSGLYNASKLLSCVALPIGLYYQFMLLTISKKVGYQALYYTDAASGLNGAVALINRLFFPCIVGLLIGSGYSKKVMKFAYLVYSVYTILSIMYGERGSWVYSIAILFWMHHKYYRKIPKKLIILIVIGGIVGLSVVDAIAEIRNQGVTIRNIQSAIINKQNNALISSVDTMGRSMGVNIMVLKDDVRYPYGSTYLLALFGSISTKICSLFGVEYVTPTKWFSQEYLGLSWGAGFTLIAEALVNFGIYITPFFIMLIGKIANVFLVPKNNKSIRTTNIFIDIVICSFMLSLTRSTTHEFFKNIFFGLVPIIVLSKFNFSKNSYEG